MSVSGGGYVRPTMYGKGMHFSRTLNMYHAPILFPSDPANGVHYCTLLVPPTPITLQRTMPLTEQKGCGILKGGAPANGA